MPKFEDDDLNDEYTPGFRRSEGWDDDTNDDWEDPDERDLTPDEMTTVRCTHCRKWILEDSPRCPYCREMQLEELQDRKPMWFVIAVIVCLLMTLAYFVFGHVGVVNGFHL